VVKIKIKRKTTLLCFIAIIASLAITFFAVGVRVFPDQTGVPLSWLRYEWRDPSYVEFVQYPQFIIDVIFWFTITYGVLVLLIKLKKK
jgi:hypothetical protein